MLGLTASAKKSDREGSESIYSASARIPSSIAHMDEGPGNRQPSRPSGRKCRVIERVVVSFRVACHSVSHGRPVEPAPGWATRGFHGGVGLRLETG